MKSNILDTYSWKHCYIPWQGCNYAIPSLILASENIEVITVPIEGLNMDYESPCDNDFLSFVSHAARLYEIDTKYPLILAPDGFILDGRHRLARLLLEGAKTVDIVRLKEMPPPQSIIEE